MKRQFAVLKQRATDVARAEGVVVGFTIADAATGAILVPGASIGIVAEKRRACVVGKDPDRSGFI